MTIQRMFKISDLPCGHSFLTEKFEHRRIGDGWTEIHCEQCGEWSSAFTSELISA
jgi:hypothetical protein